MNRSSSRSQMPRIMPAGLRNGYRAASGYMARHNEQQKALVEMAFGKLK